MCIPSTQRIQILKLLFHLVDDSQAPMHLFVDRNKNLKHLKLRSVNTQGEKKPRDKEHGLHYLVTINESISKLLLRGPPSHRLVVIAISPTYQLHS